MQARWYKRSKNFNKRPNHCQKRLRRRQDSGKVVDKIHDLDSAWSLSINTTASHGPSAETPRHHTASHGPYTVTPHHAALRSPSRVILRHRAVPLQKHPTITQCRAVPPRYHHATQPPVVNDSVAIAGIWVLSCV